MKPIFCDKKVDQIVQKMPLTKNMTKRRDIPEIQGNDIAMDENMSEKLTLLDIWGHPIAWKCSYTKPCSSKRWGIGEPHWNCIFKAYCAHQFYVAAGKVSLK